MLRSAAFRRFPLLARSARTFSNSSRPGVRPIFQGNSLQLQRIQQNGLNSTNLNSHQTRSFHTENHNDDASNDSEVPLDLEGGVRKVSAELLRQSVDEAKDVGVKCTVASLAQSKLHICADWVIKDELGNVLILWRDVAHGALLEHATVEKLEATGETHGIHAVAAKLAVLMRHCDSKLSVIHDGDEMVVVARLRPDKRPDSSIAYRLSPPISMDDTVEGKPICIGFVRHVMFNGREGIDELLSGSDFESKFSLLL
ncbi:hypothetical protein M413DRAFT_27345 [Hebeloma cylindrosporum]|uniref:Uncharacterized protein n=1 Tax=Hebeloma cylindrosporum TaxID=76867 RepID=A0A0C2YL64_HEBCY|nr:hypothetical protein M413DRAFT_27345 [Hebeloma cylindrosporum h7]